MARQKKEKSSDRKLQTEALRNLWRKVPINQWLHLLMKANPEGKWTIAGHAIKGCCPYHPDKNPSFTLSFDKCIGKCFGSCGKVVTDLIAFYAKVSRVSYTAALTDLATQIDFTEIIGPGANELSEFNRIQEMKKAAAVAMRKVIEEYVRDRPAYLEYIKPALIYLVHGRKVPINLLGHLPLGIFAKPEHLKKYIDEDYHALFDGYFEKVASAFDGGICFHYNDLPGSISRFKIREIRKEAHEECAGLELTSEDINVDLARNLAAKNFFVVDDIKDMGVFGLHYYNRMVGGRETNAYLTEGEFDALSIMVAQEQFSRTDFMIFAFGGNGNSGLSFLREFGIRTAWIVQDTPQKNGDKVVIRLLQNIKNFEGDGINKALTYKIFQWPPELCGGDLDEAVQLMGYEIVTKFLLNERMSTFINNYDWVRMQCDAEVAEVKQRLNMELEEANGDATRCMNARDSYKETVTGIINLWFTCIHNERDKLSYIPERRHRLQTIQGGECITLLAQRPQRGCGEDSRRAQGIRRRGLLRPHK